MDDPNLPAESVDVNFISEDGVMKFDFMTSLQNIAAAKVIVQLWMDTNILKAIREYIHNGPRDRTCERNWEYAWKEIEKSVLAEVSNLPLPTSVISVLTDRVPVLGHSILNWIAYNDKYVLNSNVNPGYSSLHWVAIDKRILICSVNSEHSAVDQISHLVWTARGNIDYAETARNMLADRDSPLSNDHKYKIACVYCLEEEILVLADDIVDPCYLDSMKIYVHPMVYYWTAHVTGEDTELRNDQRQHINNVSINEMIFRFLIGTDGGISKTGNEIAIYHMWNRLSDEEKERNIKPLIIELAGQDLMYSILSDMKCDQQREAFRECSNYILINILNSSLWRKYFLPVALPILDIMKPFSYFKILIEMAYKKADYREKNSYLHNEYAYFFKLLWDKGSSALKEIIFERVDSFQEFLDPLSLESDMDVIKFMFNKLTTEEKERRFFEIPCCWFDYAKKDRLDVLEHFLQSILTSGDDVTRFKSEMGRSMMGHLAERVLDDEADRILNWYFESKEQNEDARKKIANVKLIDAHQSFIASNEVDFTQFEKDLRWCARGDLNKINMYKLEFASLLFRRCTTRYFLQKLILEDKYEMLNQCLNWCFSDDRVKVAQFKSTAYKEFHSSGIPTLTALLFEEDDSHNRVDKFMDWLFANAQEVQDYKTWLIYLTFNSFGRPAPCTDFLIRNEFELADRLIEWCVPSAEDVTKFKRRLMISNEVFRWYPRSHNINLTLLIRWFNPSKELVEEFKRLVPQDECPAEFCNLLDDFLKDRDNFC